MLAVASRTTPVVEVGVRLRAAAEKVVRDVSSPGAVDDLVAGLAWTAACGQTCQLTGPVAGVRQAIAALRAGDAPSAESALRSVLAAMR
ncbi:hypothetical protein [Actinokineospora sp.]|uniref:hypothetical protein n=1 Tax=Actinokineospora sp. TaxID=1872133 RepID=UPI003D6B6483